ncbi:MAG TPA: cell wall synthesis protein CwsA [Gaiellaceae bacterium]|nr:cell wall synthesis protein CwsA [Gaiellaceae bacterium]
MSAQARQNGRRLAREALRPGRGPIAHALSDRRRHERGQRGERAAGDRPHAAHRTALLLVVAIVAALAAGLSATPARADGDPASDFLIVEKTFLPYDAKIPKPKQRALEAAVQSANAQGYKIRVALIWTDYDLGAVTALWHKPRRYATFLGIELSYYYKGRVLIVMPNGFGITWRKHDTAADYDTLDSVSIAKTPAGLADAATQAVEKLAAAAGVTVSVAGGSASTSPAKSEDRDRIVLIAAVLLAVLLGAAARFLIRRRTARPQSERARPPGR